MTRRATIRRNLDRGYPGIDQVISDLEWAMAQIERAEAVLREARDHTKWNVACRIDEYFDKVNHEQNR